MLLQLDWNIILKAVIIIIRECSSCMLYHPLNTERLQLILLTGYLKDLLQDKLTRSNRFEVHNNFPLIISTPKLAEQRWRNMEVSYDLFTIIIIFFFIQKKVFTMFFLKVIL